MSKYAKVKEVIKALEDNGYLNIEVWAIEEVTNSLDLPTIEIVHCKDCINNDINLSGTENWCLKFGYDCEDDDFCNHGERIDNE